MQDMIWSIIQLIRDSISESWDFVLFFVLILILGWCYRMVAHGLRIL